MNHRPRVSRPLLALGGLLGALLGGCSMDVTVDDPMTELETPGAHPARQEAAMAVLDAGPPDEAFLDVLQGIMWRPGYTVPTREAAFVRLERLDPDGLKITIRRHLPRLTALRWRRRLCELVADRGWVELTPALVSGWARLIPAWAGEDPRPEQAALARLWGEDRVIDVVFDTFVEARKVSQQTLRIRCWELLHHLGERPRLVALLETTDVVEGDAMLIDLRAGAVELGIIPVYREEILWLRKLREPAHAEFWSQAVQATATLAPDIRAEMEMRDIAVVVAAWRHEPALLERSRAELYESLESRLAGVKHYAHGSKFDGYDSGRYRIFEWRKQLRWADLAAIAMALRAMEVPEVVAHLFDYAERDRADTSTEYGGVIRLDDRGRFEVLEFPPRIREHDNKFIASQAMFDAAYTALFHFHFHVQVPRNVENAGPGFGDASYANGSRANCLVLTSVYDDKINVDYYRHDRVQVDLGVIDR